MEAKLRNLRQLKDKHELSNKHNLTRLDFMNSVKERIRNDHQNKQKVNFSLFSSDRLAQSHWKLWGTRQRLKERRFSVNAEMQSSS